MNNSDAYDILIRTIIAIVSLFILGRTLGKKQIAQLSFFDYILGITIGSIAAQMSIDTDIPMTNGLGSLILWSLVSLLISYVSLKSMRARRFLEGVPTVIIKNGEIIKENLKKERYHINELLEDLREKGVFNIADVEFAILETDGALSVLKKSQTQPITPRDIGIDTKYQGLSANLIIDGEIMYKHLQTVGLNEEWLSDELNKRGIDSFKDVLLASLDTDGNLYVDLKDKKKHGENKLE